MNPLVRVHLRDLAGYVPGEQPVRGDVVKLNTNESPYPPSPKVGEVLRSLEPGKLGRYPDPVASIVRDAVAERHGVAPENVFVGNGSDEVLALLVRLVLDPGDLMAIPDPTYSLYPILAALQNARLETHPLDEAFELPDSLDRTRARLVIVANPNSPTGIGAPRERLSRLADAVPGLVIVDEAYAEFAQADCLPLAVNHERVVVVRTLSKAYGLAGIRVGYAVGAPWVIDRLLATKDSFNVDFVAQRLAAAALGDAAYLGSIVGRIRATRDRVVGRLRALGWVVLPSEANFVLARPRRAAAGAAYHALRDRGIFVRFFDASRVRDYLRISVGTDDEMNRFLEAVEEIDR